MLINIHGRTFEIDQSNPIDISIPLQFNAPQPNAYGVEPALSIPCQAGEMVGDTRQGGSVNFEQYTLIPHCHGTHTECVGHITHERISVRDCLRDGFVLANLISVKPETEGDDVVISGRSLEPVLTNSSLSTGSDASLPSALIVRTFPNDDGKLTRMYDEENIPAYLSPDAMEYIVEAGFDHLLVDLPSIDRIFDEGILRNHRTFWNVEPGSFEINSGTRSNSTITELIYVPSEVPDGEYLLNLQIAPFHSDASPSRPLIFSFK